MAEKEGYNYDATGMYRNITESTQLILAYMHSPWAKYERDYKPSYAYSRWIILSYLTNHCCPDHNAVAD